MGYKIHSLIIVMVFTWIPENQIVAMKSLPQVDQVRSENGS